MIISYRPCWSIELHVELIKGCQLAIFGLMLLMDSPQLYYYIEFCMYLTIHLNEWECICNNKIINLIKLTALYVTLAWMKEFISKTWSRNSFSRSKAIFCNCSTQPQPKQSWTKLSWAEMALTLLVTGKLLLENWGTSRFNPLNPNQTKLGRHDQLG